MDETALIHDALKGDLEAFNRLVLAYQDLVYNQAYRLMDDEDAAADATQTAFISAYKNLSGFRGGSLRAWLLRIVTNACYDELRRKKAHPSISLEPVNADGEENEHPYWIVDDGVHPEEYVERRELEEAVRCCLARIPRAYREVLILVDMEGLSYVEAAESIGKPIGTIKSRLARGRMMLNGYLHRYWDMMASPNRIERVAAR